jgi:hypothetical protein
LDARETRLGRNEALFRAVNSRLEELNETFGVVSEDGFEIVCECGDVGCVDQIVIPTAEYARIREDPTLFIVVAGHENATVESVVEEDRKAYVVVRKHLGRPAEVAAETAPE